MLIIFIEYRICLQNFFLNLYKNVYKVKFVYPRSKELVVCLFVDSFNLLI